MSSSSESFYSSSEGTSYGSEPYEQDWLPPPLSRRNGVEQLAQWLKVSYPRDVLMPVIRGEKKPQFTFAGGAWTWARFDWSARAREDSDIGILLFDLCVIDVDTVAQADALEAAFPELTAAPMERTKRGRHYFFARSPLCDAHGYMDGAAQRQPGVDFKTRQARGGSGLVVTAPSTDKEWVRTPWRTCPDGRLPEISAALLDAVAAPRHVPLTVALRFTADGADSAPVRYTSPLLAQCSYFTDMLDVLGLSASMAALTTASDASASDSAAADSSLSPEPPVAPVPPQFSRRDFTDLLRVVEQKCDPEVPLADAAAFPSADAYEARIASLAAFADFMGAPPGATAALRAAGAGGGRNRGDAMRICPEWARAFMAAARASERGQLDTIDAAVSAATHYAPLLPERPRDDRWVLHEGPRVALAAGAPMLEADPPAAAAAALPSFVRRALKSEAGHLALAGGAALAAVSTRARRDAGARATDYDLFVYGFEGDAATISAAADALVRRVVALPRGVVRGSRGVAVSRNAVTLRVQSDGRGVHDTNELGGEYIVQIVLRVAANPADIVAGFDLAPAKVLVLYDKPAEGADVAAEPQLRVLAAPEWRVAMRHAAFLVDGRAWSRATALRVLKYMAKGFDALIPALRDRSLVRRTVSSASWWRYNSEKLAHLDGFELLFALERAIQADMSYEARSASLFRWRGLPDQAAPRLSAAHVARVARSLHLEQRTDYGSVLKTLRTWLYALRGAHASILAPNLGAGAHVLDGPLGWRQPWSSSQFHPVSADVLDALTLVDAA